MTFWVAGAVVVSGALNADAAGGAADTQARASNYAAELQNQQFKQTREDQMPWLKAGERALGKLENQYNAMPAAFTGAVQLNQDPGYAFRLAEGQKALERSAAARGGLISGGALKAATRYGQEMGSQEYTNAYNRAMDQYNAAVQREATGYNRLASMAGIGQTTANTLGQMGQANATNIGNLMTSGAAAQAAGRVGQANAVTGGLSTYLNYSQGNNLVNALNQNRQYNPYTPGQYTPGSDTYVGPMPQQQMSWYE